MFIRRYEKDLPFKPEVAIDRYMSCQSLVLATNSRRPGERPSLTQLREALHVYHVKAVASDLKTTKRKAGPPKVQGRAVP